MLIKKGLLIVIFLCLAFTAKSIEAEEVKKIDPKQIVNDIVLESNGNVTIEMSDDIFEILIPQKKGKKIVNKNGTYRTIGYRVQVFSDGRDQYTLEARANARGSAVLSRFPKYKGQVYTFSKSPNWFTRVGNFETIEEANDALKELKRAFPSYSGEMRVVKCEVLIRK